MRPWWFLVALPLFAAGSEGEPAGDDDDSAAPDDTLDNAALVQRLADQWIAAEPAEDQYWDWMDAVYMMGLVRAADVTGSPEHLAYPTAWVDHYYAEIEDRYPDASDRVAPNMVAVELMRLAGEDLYPDIPPQVDDYLDNVATTSGGAVLHWGTQFPEREEVLIDSLFMVGGYLTAMAHHTGDAAYLDRFAEQTAVFADLCRDPDEGLFLHAWDEAEQVNVPADPVYWGRGNGWIIAVTAWWLSVAPADHPDRAAVEEVYRGVVDGFIRYQDDSGLFWTVINRPGDDDNYLETSCTALFVYGVALGLDAGVLDGETYRAPLVAAHAGLLSQIREEDDGHLTLLDTSFGTVPTSYENYVGIPLVDDLKMGVGTALMALAQSDGN